jgi:predicted aspartyl protease
MSSVIVDIKVRGSRGEVKLKAMVDTGFYGDIITTLEKVSGLGIDFKYERVRRLPDGRIASIKYGGGEVELQGSLTYGDIEVWSDLKLPPGIDALLGVTILEKMGFRIDPKMGRLEKVELYLL